jgi:hypothetical protein
MDMDMDMDWDGVGVMIAFEGGRCCLSCSAVGVCVGK